MKYQAVFFDLFGTLVRNFSSREYQEVLNKMAIILDLSPVEFKKLWWETATERNTGSLNSIQASILYIGQKLGASPETSQIEKAIRVRLDFIKWMLTPRPYAVEVLSSLKSENYKIGLISDCSNDIPLVWDETPLALLFDEVIFSCSVGLKKPDPRIYELAVKRLDVNPGKCLFIGDGGSRELTGAARAGMHPVLIQPYGETELPQANSEAKDWRGPAISSLKEVLELVKSPPVSGVF
jgi:putative hydrolase of the HAD superfamily